MGQNGGSGLRAHQGAYSTPRWFYSRTRPSTAGRRKERSRFQAEASALAAELQDYEIRVDENANDRYRAFRILSGSQ